ncbi:hypothetical protein CBR_g51056 [Chara braunii]|uniref:HAT C-terminal dimerisation domain-containing protein n=1 Tax=Chara braunii TaxID=69332 RepID=A0A388K5X8_CHABU|nr:hypothetical protein CBR_g51056 [Chara braunii]|eukprot:GBG65462.1 hypothetical protein CBR_g51056 [Chara braunii]
MRRSQARVFEDAGEDENRKAQKKCCVYKYISVGQNIGERFRGNRMLKCLFCGREFHGNQYVAGRHFKHGKGCPTVTDKALVDIHYNTDYKLDRNILERMPRFEELHGPAPAMDPRRDEGELGEVRDDEDVVDMDSVVEEGARGGPSGTERGKGVVHVGADEAGSPTGKRKEREEGVRPGAQKRLRQNTIKESYSSQWEMEFKKRFLRFAYSQRLPFNVFGSEPWKNLVRHFRDLLGPMKVLWPLENEIVDIETVVRTVDDVVADLAEDRAFFYVTGATIMSDGKKSRDARPIVNCLVGGSRGLMMVRTMNREVRSALERTVDGDSWGIVPWDHSVRQLARLDRGGLHMSRVVQWTQNVTREVARVVRALPTDSARFIVQKVQAREAQRCTSDVETYKAVCWWSKWGQCVPQLQVIALHVMYMWMCSSPAERNWAVHEGVHTKKRNRLEFEKVAKLVEISANVRLLSHQRAGRLFALPWTLDESLLDMKGGIGTRPSWKGTDDSRMQQELESQRCSWQRDPCGSRAPPGEVAKVFGTRAATLRPHPRDDDNDYEG